jgi:demethylmenaquinone methyltransferase/2-methoxy-6-polyprenyl-1,4-benzoquinol methylase
MDKIQGNDIRRMFDAIARRYDFLNHVLSFGIDCWWRRKAVSCLQAGPGQRILDMASGTGDVALQIVCRCPQVDFVVAADLSPGMLELAADKIRRAGQAGRIFPVAASCQAIPHGDGTFDGAVIAFGIRNIPDRPAALRELVRVLKPHGRLVVLEFSTPGNRLFRALYHLYFRRFLPWLAGFFSDREAYRYLPRSVAGFPSAGRFRLLMEEAGLERIVQTPLTFGIATLHSGLRRG